MNTKHKPDCTRVWRRYDPTCPRCQELARGAAPRRGYTTLGADYDRQRQIAIAAHFAPGGPHARGECGPVCTAFDW